MSTILRIAFLGRVATDTVTKLLVIFSWPKVAAVRSEKKKKLLEYERKFFSRFQVSTYNYTELLETKPEFKCKIEYWNI